MKRIEDSLKIPGTALNIPIFALQGCQKEKREIKAQRKFPKMGKGSIAQIQEEQ